MLELRWTRTVTQVSRFAFLVLGVFLPTHLNAQGDSVRLERDGKEFSLQGEILVEAQDNGVLFLANDGQLWLVEGKEVKAKNDTDDKYQALDAKDLAKETLKDLPDGFEVYETEHFVICYNTSKAYAKWVGSVYERLYKAFRAFWKKRKWEVEEPKGPLPVILFANREQYQMYVKSDLGQDVGSMVAYYHLLTNRVAMYDLTGFDKPTERQVREFLKAPNSLQMIATVVHEATHQLVFNSGIQTRLADTPLWVNEGMAMYFESPDLSNSKGWKKIGTVNRPRLVQFRRNLASNKYFRLKSMIEDDQLFRDGKTASDIYAQAWAMNYYLFKKKPKSYVSYLQHLAKKKPLKVDDPKQRLSDFQQFFGKDLEKIERSFIAYLRQIR